MSVDLRINFPDRAEFAKKVEQLKSIHRVDELMAAVVASRLSPEARAGIDLRRIIERVKKDVDPEIVDILHDEMQVK